MNARPEPHTTVATVEAEVEAAEVVDARVAPRGSLENLSQQEVAKLLDSGQGGLYPLFRRCALAVLNTGSHSDDPRDLFERYRDFEIRIVRESWGVKLEMKNAPAAAFVDGQMIRGVKEHLFAVLRDIVYISNEIVESGRFDLREPASITNAVFCILRNARALDHKGRPDLVVCWGGHSISREEYEYTKDVGYELGLRGLNVCTGCGPGAMKGPMKGATIGHSKQRILAGRYVGLTEPGIVAAEPPNPIVNNLVIMPDIEKRLEAFVRLGHGIIVFPGGVGTAEEILYLLGILLDPANAHQPLPVVFTGPPSAAAYFERIHEFIGLTLGPAAQERYRIVVGDAAEVARAMVSGLNKVRHHRKDIGDAYNFNWGLAIPPAFQLPFEVNHPSVAALDLHLDQPVHSRAANLRRVFSAIVAGNVKEAGIREIEKHGPFEIHGDVRLMKALDALLHSFVAQKRMKISGEYRPVYRVVA
ncbi:MAG: nucleotide 5'-monophosphate nucleosidase PpnN [Steroidobacteraceae bacterium]|jgi:predicted Rossmann-fold nucleotide-binding protein|nr:nucleotide 5'-monophosphate nucleosidase PpnN [Steroidobacteraceae bacterium]